MESKEEILASHIYGLLESIELILKEKKQLPALIIVYSTIDILAWLLRPVKNEDVRASDFIRWCDLFLLPGENLRCTSKDLYAARCGILHSYSADSNRSRSGKAKQIWYSWGKSEANILEQRIQHSNYNKIAVAVQIESLVSALRNGVSKFAEYIDDNSEIGELVYERANKFFGHIPYELLKRNA